jgi:hypothetical protein
MITPERLREMRTLLTAAPGRYAGRAAEACDAAAVEIERLRAALSETVGKHAYSWSDETRETLKANGLWDGR